MRRAIASTVFLPLMAVALLAACATTEPASPRVAATAEPAPTPTVEPVPRTATDPSSPAEPRIPAGVTIPAVGIDMPVTPVGVAEGGAMELPPDVAVAGWYRFGPDLDADRGTVVLAAHVDSLTFGIGPFARLRDLPAGAEILVTDAAGVPRAFLVASVESVPKAELPLERVFDRDGAPRLVLITCGGTFDRTARTYSDNVIVTATPKEP